MRYYKYEGKSFQLYRCPFCGNDAVEVWTQSERDDTPSEPERYTIVCPYTEGGCGATCGYHGSVHEAVRKWNTRALKKCCGNCLEYDGDHCIKDWNNADKDYYIPDRDDKDPDDCCDDWEYDDNVEE